MPLPESVAKPLLWLLWSNTSHPKLHGVNPPFIMLTDSVDQGFGQGIARRARSLARLAVHAGFSAETSAGAIGCSTYMQPVCVP